MPEAIGGQEMTVHPSPPKTPSADVPGNWRSIRRLQRWQFIVYSIVLFCLLAMIGSLALHHHLMRRFEGGVPAAAWQIARSLELLEGLLAGLLVVFVGAVAYYGHRVAQQMWSDRQERDTLLRQIHDAEEKYRSIFDQAVEGIFQSSADGRYLTANQALANMYGYKSPAELMAAVTDISRIYANPSRRRELIQLLEHDDVIVGFEAEVIRADGHTMWIRENVRAVRDAAGQLLYQQGTVEDITESWWAERRCQVQYATTRVLAEADTVAEARPKILQTICELLDGEMGAVWEVDSAGSALRCVEVWHRPEIDIDEFQKVSSEMQVEWGTGLVGSACATRAPACSAELQQYADMPDMSIAIREGMRSAFAVPINAGQDVLHVMQFFSPKSAALDPELLQILGTIGMQLGSLIARKRADEALRESEARKAAILSSALDCVITFDHEGKVTEFNPAAERAFGHKREAVLGKEMAQLIIPESMRETHRRGLALSGAMEQSGGGGRRVEMIAMRADRTEFPVEVGITRIAVMGKPMFTAYIRDITERKRAERVRSELASVVESSNDAIVGLTLDGIIVSWNTGAERIYGYGPEEVLGQPLFLLVPPEKIDELAQMLASIKRGRGVANFETIRIRKDRKRINVSITESPIRHEQGRVTGISSIARDITENKRLEEQLLQSQKMEAVGRLAGGVAHDFNNILTAILGYSDLLLQQIEPGHPMFKHLSGIRQSGELAATLTHQLLAFSRRQPLQLKIFNINDAVTDIQKMLRRLIGEDVHIATVLAPALGLIKADPGQLQQVLLNLAVNARDAMPNGGVITFQTSNISVATDDLYHTNELAAGDYVKLTVSDTGTGMGEEVRKHIFEPFFTTKEKGKGTGLGLATCYGIVKQCAGHIVVESQPGQGTTFQIYLPRADSPSSVVREEELEPALPGGTESVLIVEDEAAVRDLTAHILESLGYVVLEAKDGDSARTIIMERNGNVDLMFVDVVLPDVGGSELAAWVERLHPGSRVLFTSGYMEEALFKHYGLNAESAFLQKPFTPADLAWKVRATIDSSPGRRAKPSGPMVVPEEPASS